MSRIQATLQHHVREAYMEIFPTGTIEARLDVLQPGSYVAVTCSPSQGVATTLAMCERLAARGFKVVPHVAARMVQGKRHLREIVARLSDLPIISLFVPGGDAEAQSGCYQDALQLLRDLAEMQHGFDEIGVAAHPEGHPDVDDDVLMQSLAEKQNYANYVVTQMCFDADVLRRWLASIRDRGIDVPVWLGIPGVASFPALLRTSLRIGVGDSVRFLKRNSKNVACLLTAGQYTPDDLLKALAPTTADSRFGVAGFHLFCFNEVERTEEWRAGLLQELRQ